MKNIYIYYLLLAFIYEMYVELNLNCVVLHFWGILCVLYFTVEFKNLFYNMYLVKL